MTVLVLPGGCDRQSRWQQFEIQDVVLNWSNGRLDAKLKQNLELSDQAREALQHGVPLFLRLDLIVRDTSTRTRVKEYAEHYEIRFLPLSNRFQLSFPGGDEFRTFPRLRHLLADLDNLHLDLRTGVLPQGNYEVLTRIRLDQRKMPMSMRLPTMFRADWKHDSRWSSWPLEISSPA